MHISSTRRTERPHRRIGAQDFLIDSPWPRPLPLIGQPLTPRPRPPPHCSPTPPSDVVARPRPLARAPVRSTMRPTATNALRNVVMRPIVTYIPRGVVPRAPVQASYAARPSAAPYTAWCTARSLLLCGLLPGGTFV